MPVVEGRVRDLDNNSQPFFRKWYSESSVENTAALFQPPVRAAAPTMTPPPTDDGTQPEELTIKFSDSCIEWLHQNHISFVVSTYQVGKILTIGHHADGRFSVFERTFDRCMGCLNQRSKWIFSQLQKSDLTVRAHYRGQSLMVMTNYSCRNRAVSPAIVIFMTWLSIATIS